MRHLAAYLSAGLATSDAMWGPFSPAPTAWQLALARTVTLGPADQSNPHMLSGSAGHWEHAGKPAGEHLAVGGEACVQTVQKADLIV